MADNTISPVVPNVSGGRTVSTGQKSITQTSAQSGIDFKSYLGGRTAVQDNSTTFLKRRNSYTLNKNNTKEISIKTASKNSHTESEVKKITDDISSQIVEKVTDDLDISEDELNNSMQLLGLTAMDLLNPANLSALYCEVTGNASDPQTLVLNADFTALFNDVSEVASENDAQLDLLSQLTASDDGEILDAGIVSSADTTDATESNGSVNTPEKTVDSRYDVMLDYCRRHNRLSDYEPFFVQWSDEQMCNYAITLCHMVDRMMMSFLKGLEQKFITEGGIKERMHKARTALESSLAQWLYGLLHGVQA